MYIYVKNPQNKFPYVTDNDYSTQRKSSASDQCVSQKKSPHPRGPDISHFSHKRLRIFIYIQ